MHPTRDTQALIFSRGAGGRVMPGVMLLRRKSKIIVIMNVLAANPHISLVIPAYNEAALLPRLLDSIDIARQVFARSGGTVEIIVADNCSIDETRMIAAGRDCKVVSVEQRCIAAVRNAGAKIAMGKLLAFVDADGTIHPQTFKQLSQILADDSIVGGATGVTLERWSLGLAVTYALIYPFLVLTRMDTGVVFCRRADFDLIGGYDERLKFAEDVAFLWALRCLGKRRGQRLTRATCIRGVASTRKFDEHGDWHYFWLLRKVAVCMFNRKKVEEIADSYWYKPSR
ncbi:MAG: glycosyltransferase [Acidobacteria bacterium]|nr:glycosyltransferase [Acidobacteriota bacterium]